MNLLDFDDLLTILYKKMLNGEISFEYKYVFVDEFQDTNEVQYLIVKQLSIKASILCVGDPDQSIYAFRGANRLIINKYIGEFKPDTFFLTNNYRSDKNIINFANGLMKNNIFRIKKHLVGLSEHSGVLEVIKYTNIENRNDIIMNKIKNLSTKDICVLYRVNKSAFSLRKIMNDFFSDKFNIMSIHQSKGLEFDYAFIIDCNDDKIPGYVFSLTQLEEERRIFFVAITRARRGLFLLYDENQKISRFISEATRK
jgi:DNA helicase-2/ATP-dependent DNA helicase PcrA